MASSSLSQAENCILHLETSLSQTSKNIQQSKELIYSLQQNYQSTNAHHSLSINKKDVQSLHLNINMSIENQKNGESIEDPQFQFIRINGEKYVKERGFGKVTKKLDFQDIKTDEEFINKQSQGKIRIQKQSQPYQNNNHIHKQVTSQQDINDEMKFSFTSCRRIESQKKVQNTSESNMANRYMTAKKTVIIESQQLSQTYNLPLRKTILDNDETPKSIYQRMNSERSKSRKPIFFGNSKKNKQQDKIDFDERFKNIKQKLRMTESMIEDSLEKTKKRQNYREIYQKQYMNKSNKFAYSTNDEMKIKNDNSQNIKNINTSGSRSRNKDRFQSQKKSIFKKMNKLIEQPECKSKSHSKSHHSSCKHNQSPKKKSVLLEYLSKSSYYIRNHGIVTCDKFRRQIQKDTRQRYLSEAMKIPGIEKYYTYSEIYQLYIIFRKMDLPQYRWMQFLTQKVRAVGRFLITEQRYTTV